MPKKTKRSARPAAAAQGANRPDGGTSDDESVFNDNASVVSNVSSGSYMKEDVANGDGNAAGGQVDELSQDEIFEEKLREAMDLASQKSGQGRTSALISISTAFMKKLVPDFVEDRRMTLTDIVERAMKKGKPAEQVAAANLAVLICVQMGGSTSAEEVVKDLRSTFITTVLDPSAPLKARSAAAAALGNCCFLAASVEEFQAVMGSLEKIFLSNLGTTPDHYSLQTAALSGWTMLMTLLPPSRSFAYLTDHYEQLEKLLEAPDVDLRIATGEAIVVLYENACEHDEDAAVDAVEHFVPQLQELAKDSHRYRSKKERKEQKSSFRDILKTVEDGDEYFEKVTFSQRETLEINSWSMKKQYDSLCKVLASGMNLHLSENELVRGVFDMGAPIPALLGMLSSKQPKHERQQANQLAFKYRTQTRGKHRDKRSAVI